jgi:hypothetical protein
MGAVYRGRGIAGNRAPVRISDAACAGAATGESMNTLKHDPQHPELDAIIDNQNELIERYLREHQFHRRPLSEQEQLAQLRNGK